MMRQHLTDAGVKDRPRKGVHEFEDGRAELKLGALSVREQTRKVLAVVVKLVQLLDHLEKKKRKNRDENTS